MAPQVPNPFWPNLYAEANFGNNPFYTPSASQAYTSIDKRLQKSWSVRRGKQFELDQVQPGEFHGEWANKDGALDPTNASGPYTGGVLPYRGYRMRAAYPASINLLTQDQATSGEGTPIGPGTIPASMEVGSDIGGSTFTIAASSTAYQGAQVLQSAMPVSAPVGFYILKFLVVPVVAPTSWTSPTYTFSTYVRCATAGVNPTVAAALKFYDINHNYINDYAGSTVVLTGATAASWTRVTITQAVPAGASIVEAAVVLGGTSPVSTWTFQQDGSQLEQSGSASDFVVPGTNYSLYSGMIERYPQSWEYTGTYGIVQPVCVDTMALLSQTVLQEAFVMDVVATNPTWFFPLNEPSGATVFNEQGGRLLGTASIFASSQGPGTLTSGNPVTATAGANGIFYGANGPVVTVNNTVTSNQGSVIDLTTAGVAPPSSGAWTRMIAFRTSQNAGNQPMFASYTNGVSPAAAGNNGNMYFGLTTTGGSNWNVGVSFYDNAGNRFSVSCTTAYVNNGNWHLAFVQMSADGKTITVWADSITASGTTTRDMHSTIAVNDSIGGDAYKESGLVNYNGLAPFNGDIAMYAHWNTLLTSDQITSLTDSFLFAYIFDRVSDRYARILAWAGYQGDTNLDVSSTTVTHANDIAGVDALSALQALVETENGRHFVGADGAINFHTRRRYFQQGSASYQPGPPSWVFGENVAAGEIPYSGLAFDFDPTRISNQIAVTQNSTGLVYNANDTTSQANYGIRNLARSSQSTDAEEVRESSYYLLSRYKDPHLRVQTLKIDVSAYPSVWSSALSFEIGQYIQINRRDGAGLRPTVTMYGFIEQITHTGDDKSNWVTELEVSPAPSIPYATFTSLVTTLNATAAAGQPLIVINALPDAAVNPVRASIGDGLQYFVTGGGHIESLTVATGGVQDQAAGYTTAQLTMTTNLVHTYPAGSVVSELPAPYDWSPLAVFDSSQFSY